MFGLVFTFAAFAVVTVPASAAPSATGPALPVATGPSPITQPQATQVLNVSSDVPLYDWQVRLHVRSVRLHCHFPSSNVT